MTDATGPLKPSAQRVQDALLAQGPCRSAREIFEHNKAAFHARFRDHAARIMRRHGFAIVSMWEARSDSRTEFVYLLAWPDELAKNSAWAAFMADEEWKEIKRVTREQHGELVGQIEDRVLVLTDYDSH